ncbi:MAG: tRNA (adenosine(37)-N6)-threonylcarbamoyltransferase complex ATPase subunit type 1 TsaE [Nitrospirota bacterium]
MEVRGDLLGYCENAALQKKYLSHGPNETQEIGFKIGKLLKPGDIVGLYGELGSGKTTLVKGIARAFGIDERDIVSASFTIISGYNTNPPFTHIDLYRIEKKAELIELGLWEQIGGDSVSVIEWAEKAEGELPGDIIKVRLESTGKNSREIMIEGIDEKNRNHL